MKTLSTVVLVLYVLITAIAAQDLGFERSRHAQILKTIKDDIKKNYYDPQFRGINLDERFKQAEEKIKQAASIGQMSGIIAQALVDFNDSHLFFVPPGKANKTRYGFEVQMVGEKCFVSRVSEKSDAFKKGLRVGDEILDIERYIPTRQNLWLMNYYYRALRPQPVLNVAVRKPDGKESAVPIEARIAQGKRVMNLADSSFDINQFIRESEDAYSEARKQFIYKQDNQLMIWQLPAFILSPADVDSVMDEAKGKAALIIDLRNNSGGRVDSLKRLVGHFFDRDIKIGDEKTRKESKEVIAKTKGKDAFTGKLIVLIDSESGSASEVFAKVIQLEKRGLIFGDVSAGAVMESRYFPHQIGLDTVVFYGVSVTIADLIMTDGKSLEKVGVVPDELILPTANDMANKQDVVLSKAVRSLGLEMTPEQAWNLFAKEKQNYKDAF